MAEFNVTWEIDVDAGSPEDAARMARVIQRDRRSTANVYLVGDEAGNRTTVEVEDKPEQCVRCGLTGGMHARDCPYEED